MSQPQLGLFAAEPPAAPVYAAPAVAQTPPAVKALLSELESLSVDDTTTPMAALNLIAQWKRSLTSSPR